MDSADPDDLAERVARARAQLQKLESAMERARPNDPILTWRLVDDFFEPYQEARKYPLELLPALTYRLMDLKLQLFFVVASPGMHNALFSGTPLDLKGDPLLNTPGLYLEHLAFMQGQIAQVRALWERLMNLVYFLEMGREMKSKSGSFRGRFFSDLPKFNRNWEVLAEWDARIDKYDRNFRTPEFHSGSTLRKSLFGEPVDPNAVYSLIQPVSSGFWEVLTATIKGEASPITQLGRFIDPEFDGIDALPDDEGPSEGADDRGARPATPP